MIILKKATELKKELNLKNVSLAGVRSAIVTPFIKNDLTYRKIVNKLKKRENELQAEKDQKEIQEIVLTIEWKKSSIWGSCPSLTADIHYTDGTYKNTYGASYRASGYGYDKESTVVASFLNDYMKYALWNKCDVIQAKKERLYNVPYGISNYAPDYLYFEGGVGMSCYYSIMTFLGYELKHISNGKTFDVYIISKN